MSKSWKNILQIDLAAEEQREQLAWLAARRNWGLALLLVGWLHLVAFSLCYYLTIGLKYHESLGHLLIWVSELAGVWGIFRLCAGPRPADLPPIALENFVRRVWTSYFILAFNLGSLHTLRGHHLFEFFPAMASLASFAFLMMTVTISWRFFGAVVVMFIAGLLMAAYLWHAHLIFAVAWWLVLNVIGLDLLLKKSRHVEPAPLATDLPPDWCHVQFRRRTENSSRS
jgi:hypothetical protein